MALLICRRTSVVFLLLIISTALLVIFLLYQDALHSDIHMFRKKTDPSTFISEDSPSGDHEQMAFMRKYGRLYGLPQETELINMTRKEMLYIYHSYLSNSDILCHRRLRMGGTGDGGWELCDDYPYRPVSPCIVYSFGINGDFTFDDDIAKLYGCHVYAFDPSMAVKSHNRSDKVHFYQMGLSGADHTIKEGSSAVTKGWELKTLSEIKQKMGHANSIIDVLKIDIEFSEWPALNDMLKTGVLKNVRQFFIEFHTHEYLIEKDDEYREHLRQMSAIEAIGFRRFYTHLNPLCSGKGRIDEFPNRRTCAYEVYFVNTNLKRGLYNSLT